MTTGIGYALIIIYTIIIWIIYHKIFDVYYFNLSKGLLIELVLSFIGGMILAGLTISYWYIAAIILLLLGFGLSQKTTDPNKRKVCIVTFAIFAVVISIVGISANLKDSDTSKTGSNSESLVQSKNVSPEQKHNESSSQPDNTSPKQEDSENWMKSDKPSEKQTENKRTVQPERSTKQTEESEKQTENKRTVQSERSTKQTEESEKQTENRNSRRSDNTGTEQGIDSEDSEYVHDKTNDLTSLEQSLVAETGNEKFYDADGSYESEEREIPEADVYYSDNVEYTSRLYFWNVFMNENEYSENPIIYDATSFQEGFSWIVVVGDYSHGDDFRDLIYENKVAMYLINTEGEVVFTAPIELLKDIYLYSSTPVLKAHVTSISNGLCLLVGLDNSYLINTKGEILWTLMDNALPEGQRIFGNDAVKSVNVYMGSRPVFLGSIPDTTIDALYIWNNGRSFNGYFGVEYTIESFDANGIYYGVVGPDGSWMIEPSLDTTDIINCFNSSLAYFSIENSVGETKYYNIDTGEETSREEDVKLWELDSYCKEHDGLAFCKVDGNYAFVNNEGDVIIDLSPYDIYLSSYVDRYVFHDGYCAFQAYNNTGTLYLIVIDKEGNRVMTPVEGSEAWTFMDVSEDQIAIIGHQYFKDLEGNDIGNEYEEIYPYSCGLSLVKGSYPTKYLFIDVNDNNVFPNP